MEESKGKIQKETSLFEERCESSIGMRRSDEWTLLGKRSLPRCEPGRDLSARLNPDLPVSDSTVGPVSLTHGWREEEIRNVHPDKLLEKALKKS